MQSANFGKGFLGPDVPLEVVNEFVEMCHQLRVLNSVRDSNIGIPITFRQYPQQLYNNIIIKETQNLQLL